MKGMKPGSKRLAGRKADARQGRWIFPLPECPKLALDPGQVLSEDLVAWWRRAARLVELGAKTSRRAAVLCQEILVLQDALTQAQSDPWAIQLRSIAAAARQLR